MVGEHSNTEASEIIEIPGGILNAGIGYISIPQGLDVDDFIQRCYDSQTVSIYAGMGHSFYSDIAIDEEVLQKISFPKDSETFGSTIVWVNIPKHNKPIIVASIKNLDDIFKIETNSKRITRTFNGNSIDVNLKANSATLDVNIIGNDETDPTLNINIVNPNKSGKLKIKVKGNIILQATENMLLTSENNLQLSVIDPKGKIKGILQYVIGKGLTYKDEFGNSIFANEDNLQLKPKNKLNVGEGKEPMLLGQSSKNFFDEFIDTLASSTVTTALGLMPLMNATQISALKEKTQALLSKYGFLD